MDMEEIKFTGFGKTILEVNIENSFWFDMAEPESEPGGLRSAEGEKGPPVSDEQFNFPYAYFKDMSSEPLLTPKQEVEVSAKIKKYEARAKEIKAILDGFSNEGAEESKRISKENGHQNGNGKMLPRRVQRLKTIVKAYLEKSKGLKERFVKANLRLVITLARRYTGRGIPLADLIQEGNMGLMKAVEKFDHTKGYKFSTYASWWIHQAMSRAPLDQMRTIRVPANVLKKASRVYRINSTLHEKMGRK